MKFETWHMTDPGLRRERNEDSYLVDNETGLFAVADGMGGHRGGEVASRIAVETLSEVVRKGLKSGARRVNPRQILADAYDQACQRIFKMSQTGGDELQGMGTTLVAGLHFDDTLYIANVGDSRCYLFAKNFLWPLTEDHSFINEQLRAGLITEADIERAGSRNVITRSVGFEKEVQVDIIERPTAEGELYLFCSDGLYGLVEDARIQEICRTSTGQDMVTNCIEEAKKNGGDDNVSVVAIYARGQ